MLRRHAFKAALAAIEGKGTRRIVPVNRNGGVSAACVSIAVALIFVEGELAIPARIDTKLDRIGGLPRVLDLRPERKDRARAHIERNALEWRAHIRACSACCPLTRPEVIPVRACRQIDLPSGSMLGKHGAHQDRRTEKKLVSDIPGGR